MEATPETRKSRPQAALLSVNGSDSKDSADGKYYQRDIVALPEGVPVDLRELLVYQLLYIFHSELIDEAAHDQAAYSCWVIMHRYFSPRS